MNDQQIIQEINQLKEKVSKIVKKIQILKSQLASSKISLADFKKKKTTFEKQLRNILKKIAHFKGIVSDKETDQIKGSAEVIEPIEDKETTKTIMMAEGKKVAEVGEQLQKEIMDASQLIERESKLAEISQNLLYYFQTEFEDVITTAKIYLSITPEEHFIIGIDFSNYPRKPILNIPAEILELLDNNEQEFFRNIPSYVKWDSNNPKEIYELIWEIETFLINMYQVDIKEIENKAIEYINTGKKTIENLIKEAQDEIKKNNFGKVKEIYYTIIDIAHDIQEIETASFYSEKLDELLKSV